MFAFLISAIAGFLTPMAEPVLKKALGDVLLQDVPMGEGEFRNLTFVVMLFAAAVLVALAGSGAPAVTVVLGGGLGLFGTRIYAMIKAKIGS